jgi:hypothetical protein
LNSATQNFINSIQGNLSIYNTDTCFNASSLLFDQECSFYQGLSNLLCLDFSDLPVSIKPRLFPESYRGYILPSSPLEIVKLPETDAKGLTTYTNRALARGSETQIHRANGVPFDFLAFTAKSKERTLNLVIIGRTTDGRSLNHRVSLETSWITIELHWTQVTQVVITQEGSGLIFQKLVLSS